MKVTTTEVPDSLTDFSNFWDTLVLHVKENKSELVLLNEFSFIKWFASKDMSDEIWASAIQLSGEWEKRLSELNNCIVLGSRPIVDGGKRYNEAFIWTSWGGIQGVHRKNYLPDEEPCWEMSWYSRGDGTFIPTTVTDDIRIGFLMCSELWFNEHARKYGKQGVDIIVVPRATELNSLSNWEVGGKAAAIVSGAYVLSSNRVGNGFGGQGWIIDPNGSTLARTDKASPIVTVDIDLSQAVAAKLTYPRNVLE